MTPETTVEDDVLTVCFGEQKFAPIQYQSFSVGPFFMKTTIQPGETTEEAFERVWPVLLGIARRAYEDARQAFFSGAEGG